MKIRSAIFLILLLTLLSTGCTKNNQEAALSISPQGGTYQAFNGATVDVPENAVREETEISLRSLSQIDLEDLPEGNFPILTAFEALPNGQTFAEPITITLTHLNLEPGTIPLVRIINEATGDRYLLGTEAAYDPQAGTLTFSVDHFTTYAVEAGEQVANTECQVTPCRCGAISIQQSDTSNACGSDDCQILESEVSVQFNDCPGKPVESSYLKEVSPSCTPHLDFQAARETIPPGGSTTLTASTYLSCVPVPGQSTDFSIETGLGSVEPTFGSTDKAGKAQTTFSAAEQEGTTTVTANATGSYYAYEIRANQETFNGPMLTYQLSEQVGITVKELRGEFEGSFSGCNIYVCLDDYHIKLQFDLAGIPAEGEWLIPAQGTQSGSLRSNFEDYVIEYLDIPETIQIDLYGRTINQSGDITLFINDLGGSNLIGFKLIWPEDPSWLPIENFRSMITPGFNEEGQGEPFHFNINQTGTQEGSAYLALLGMSPENPGISGPYKLIVK